MHYISHDLRAPLRGIDGYSRALMEDYDTRLDEMGKAYLQYIFESSARLNQLIDGLLNWKSSCAWKPVARLPPKAS